MIIPVHFPNLPGSLQMTSIYDQILRAFRVDIDSSCFYRGGFRRLALAPPRSCRHVSPIAILVDEGPHEGHDQGVSFGYPTRPMSLNMAHESEISYSNMTLPASLPISSLSYLAGNDPEPSSSRDGSSDEVHQSKKRQVRDPVCLSSC